MCSLKLTLFSLCLIGYVAYAGPVKPKIDRDIESLIHLAYGMPPAYAADGLLRLLEAGKIPRPMKAEILERAAAEAASVTQPYALQAVPIGFTDAPGSQIASATRLRIDRLSLSCRVVAQWLPIDAVEARRVFQSVAKSIQPQSGCDSAVAPDLRFFYETFQQVAEKGFTRKQIAEGEKEDFVTEYISKISSSSQVFPGAKMLSGLTLDEAATGRVLSLFSSTIAGLEPDERSFAVELFMEPSRKQMQSLLSRFEGRPEYGALLGAVASFYHRNLTAVRCSDLLNDEVHVQTRAEALGDLNSRLRSIGAADRMVTEPKSDVVKSQAAAKLYDFTEQSPQYDKLMRVLQGFNTPPSADTQDADRKDVILSALDTLEHWDRPEPISARDFFLMKSELFAGLVNAAAGGPVGRRVLASYLSFLNLNESARLEYAAEWLWRVKKLFDGPRPWRDRPGDMQRWQEQVAGELERSPNAALYLYGRLRKTVGPI